MRRRGSAELAAEPAAVAALPSFNPVHKLAERSFAGSSVVLEHNFVVVTAIP